MLVTWTTVKLKTPVLRKKISREGEDKQQAGRNNSWKTYRIKDPYSNMQRTNKFNNKKTNNSTENWALH